MKKAWKYLYFISCGIYLIFQSSNPALSFNSDKSADNKNPVPSSTLSTPAVTNLSFAILNHDLIMQEAIAAQQARSEIDKQRNDFQEEIIKYEQKLRDREKKLVDSQQTLTEIEYAKKQQEYEQEYSDIQQKVAQRRRQLEESFNIARKKIVDAILKIVIEVAHEHSLQLVLPCSMVLFAQEKCDITDEVLNRLNKVLPRVSLETEHQDKKTKDD